MKRNEKERKGKEHRERKGAQACADMGYNSSTN